MFASQLKPTLPPEYEGDKVFNVPFCDPPLVSPHDAALAVPVSVLGLWASFAEVRFSYDSWKSNEISDNLL